MTDALRLQYCGMPCEACPVLALAAPEAVGQEVDLMFQEYGPRIGRSTTEAEAIAMAVEASTSSPEAIGQAVVRHVTGQCKTSPETSSL